MMPVRHVPMFSSKHASGRPSGRCSVRKGRVTSTNNSISMFSSMQERNSEDIHGIYIVANSSLTKLCLDELVVPVVPAAEEQILQNEVELSPEMWLNLNASEYYAGKETIL